MADKKKPNWIKIRTEYETTNTSYRKLAEKYKVSENTLEARARREKWNKCKEKVTDKITEKLREKTIDKVVDLNTKHFDLWDLLFDRIKENIGKEMLQVMNPFTGENVEVDRDAKDLSEIAKAIEKLQKGQRLAKNMLTEFEKRKLEMDREKLEIEKTKQDKESGETVIKVYSNIPRPKPEDGENEGD